MSQGVKWRRLLVGFVVLANAAFILIFTHRQPIPLTYVETGDPDEFRPYYIEVKDTVINGNAEKWLISNGAPIRGLSYDPLFIFSRDTILYWNEMAYKSMGWNFFTLHPLVDYEPATGRQYIYSIPTDIAAGYWSILPILK